jgi:hypothetical protein
MTHVAVLLKASVISANGPKHLHRNRDRHGDGDGDRDGDRDLDRDIDMDRGRVRGRAQHTFHSQLASPCTPHVYTYACLYLCMSIPMHVYTYACLYLPPATLIALHRAGEPRAPPNPAGKSKTTLLLTANSEQLLRPPASPSSVIARSATELCEAPCEAPCGVPGALRTASELPRTGNTMLCLLGVCSMVARFCSQSETSFVRAACDLFPDVT